VCDGCGGLSRGDERNAQSQKDRGDTEPYRSPETKLRGARWRFATASPNKEEPLGAALNPPLPWCPNDTKRRPRQCEATGDEERSADYHASNVPGWSGTSPSDAQSRAATGAGNLVAAHYHEALGLGLTHQAARRRVGCVRMPSCDPAGAKGRQGSFFPRARLSHGTAGGGPLAMTL
jgi:hypothetical protein